MRATALSSILPQLTFPSTEELFAPFFWLLCVFSHLKKIFSVVSAPSSLKSVELFRFETCPQFKSRFPSPCGLCPSRRSSFCQDTCSKGRVFCFPRKFPPDVIYLSPLTGPKVRPCILEPLSKPLLIELPVFGSLKALFAC